MTADWQVTLHPRFSRDASKFSGEDRKRIDALALKLMNGLERNGIHLEPLQNVPDRRMRSARVTRAIRAMVFYDPPHLVLFGVDQHDKAYDRIQRTRFDVGELFGNLEVTEVAPTIEHRSESSGNSDERSLFSPWTDRELTDLGIAGGLLPSLRLLQTEGDLLGLVEDLTPLTSQILVHLAAGEPYDDILESITRPSVSEEPVDTGDLSAAIARPASGLTTVDEHVKIMLDKGFEEWQVFLHPTQRDIVDRRYNGPARVTGGPGTGKTVVALHRAVKLARELPEVGEQRILVTTYTKRLTNDLQWKLARLAAPGELDRIDVVNIDKLAYDVAARSAAAPVRLRWDDHAALSRAKLICKDSVDPDFLVDEWKNVILAQLIRTQNEYFAASRVGRGKRLGRADRARIWELVQTLEQDLQDEGVRTGDQMVVDAALHEENRRWREPRKYRHVIIDEAQDLNRAHWRLLRALCEEGPDDMFIAGDSFQRLYRDPIRLTPLGVHIVGRSRHLTLNYRTTRQIVAKALSIMSSAGDGAEGETLAGYQSVLAGANPRFQAFSGSGDLTSACVEQVNTWLDQGAAPSSIVVCAPTRGSLLTGIVEALHQAQVPARLIGDGNAEYEGVHVATANSLKGTEYGRVLLTGVSADEFPRRFATRLETVDRTAHARALEKERNLLFVAATRARESLSVFWKGEPSHLLRLDTPA
ncbi:UvrD-helicase domain-containing protein [Salininema proteolyticum]|uniref:DNA 3'-5' helicase n=1 Tax=Salininema proteolyticum TaxID=1607685 RepID=A0ABV8U2L4_9ACTN